jgi:hypothetical protein
MGEPLLPPLLLFGLGNINYLSNGPILNLFQLLSDIPKYVFLVCLSFELLQAHVSLAFISTMNFLNQLRIPLIQPFLNVLVDQNKGFPAPLLLDNVQNPLVLSLDSHERVFFQLPPDLCALFFFVNVEQTVFK